MSTFTVDADGKRINTDILISGYIRNISNRFKLLIPIDIIQICFQYWLITICDEWDKKLSSDKVAGDGQIVTAGTSASYASIYGCLGIDKGSYTWQVKLKSEVRWFCMGIIEDDDNILTKYRDGCGYVLNNGCCLHDDGKFYLGSQTSGKSYIDGFPRSAETIIAMTLNMDDHTLSYKINAKDYGIVTNKLDKSKYRLVISFYYANHSVELL